MEYGVFVKFQLRNCTTYVFQTTATSKTSRNLEMLKNDLVSLLYIQRYGGRKMVSEYDQEIPQSNTWRREEELQNINSNKTSVRQQKQINQLSLPLQDN